MSAHIYKADTRIVLMGKIRVADWRKELRHFELSVAVADALLQRLQAEDNELGLTGSELLDLLQGQGQIASIAKLSNASEKVAQTMAALTKLAWEHEVPFSVDEMERCHSGDEYFDDFTAAYTVVGGEAI